jgi:hypothetical protein
VQLECAKPSSGPTLRSWQLRSTTLLAFIERMDIRPEQNRFTDDFGVLLQAHVWREANMDGGDPFGKVPPSYIQRSIFSRVTALWLTRALGARLRREAWNR